MKIPNYPGSVRPFRFRLITVLISNRENKENIEKVCIKTQPNKSKLLRNVLYALFIHIVLFGKNKIYFFAAFWNYGGAKKWEQAMTCCRWMGYDKGTWLIVLLNCWIVFAEILQNGLIILAKNLSIKVMLEFVFSPSFFSGTRGLTGIERTQAWTFHLMLVR